MGKSKAAKQEVPECRYGSACTRWNCVFKHPPKKAAAALAKAGGPEKSDRVCFAYVVGRCAFGKLCRDKHPDETSCKTIMDRYAKIDCQWGKGCRTEGCLYRHPSDEVVGPALPSEPPVPQPAVFADGPTIRPQPVGAALASTAGPAELVAIPRAIWQAAEIRDATAFDIADPLERFFAVNVHNTGSQSAALVDLHFQSTQTFQAVLDAVLSERLRMFSQGVWVITGTGHHAPSKSHQKRADNGVLFDAVRDYLVRRRFDYAVGNDEEGQQGAFLVRGRLKRKDPLEGVRAVLLCGLPGAGKSGVAEALVRRSNGRFARVCQDEFQGSARACEEAFKAALRPSSSEASGAPGLRSRPGSPFWDQAFSPERQCLAISLRTSALAFLSECCGIPVPHKTFLQATLAFQPTALDLRRHLGRAFRVTFRCHLVLEGIAPPHTGELFEAVLCAGRAVDAGPGARPIAMHVTLAAPRGAAKHLQVLNQIPFEKRIHANAIIGSFRVRQIVDLASTVERVGLCLLMHKAGDQRDSPCGVSFDPRVLRPPSGAEWTELGDAALVSLDPLVVVEDAEGQVADHEWLAAAAARCATLGLEPPQLQVSRPLTPTETRLAQWRRLRPQCMLHAAGDEAEVATWLRAGMPVLRPPGGAGARPAVALPPPTPEANETLPRIVVLDRCNAERAERKRWVEAVGGLSRSEVLVLQLDVPEAECIARLVKRGDRHPTLPVRSTVEAAQAVRAHGDRYELPSEREGFKAILRMKGTASAEKELVKRWTEEGAPVEADEGELSILAGAQAGEEECPAPPLPLLRAWMEQAIESEPSNPYAEYSAAASPAVGAAWGAGGGASEAFGDSSGTRPGAAVLGWPSDAQPASQEEAGRGPGANVLSLMFAQDEEMERSERLLATRNVWQPPSRSAVPPPRDPELVCQAAEAANRPWPTLGAHGPPPDEPVPPPPVPTELERQRRRQEEEDEEERQRAENLAATLRCMGFDEEPSLTAARRAGGDLNIAVERMLHGDGGHG